jgi:hypothetical protein
MTKAWGVVPKVWRNARHRWPELQSGDGGQIIIGDDAVKVGVDMGNNPPCLPGGKATRCGTVSGLGGAAEQAVAHSRDTVAREDNVAIDRVSRIFEHGDERREGGAGGLGADCVFMVEFPQMAGRL